MSFAYVHGRIPQFSRAIATTAALGMAACASPETSNFDTTEASLVENARTITANPDGSFDVVCKDNSRETSVSADDIVANRICNPKAPPVTPPPPPSTWSTAKHNYRGAIYAVTADNRFAFVDLDGVGFGRFDLKTYALTSSYGDSNDYPKDGNYYPHGVSASANRIALVKAARHAGSTAQGLRIELRDLSKPSFHYSLDRAPSAGAGNLLLTQLTVCSDGRTQWTESGARFNAVVVGGKLTAEAATTTLSCASGDLDFVADYPDDWSARKDLIYTTPDRIVKRCTGATCTTVRTMPVGTKWVVFSKSGNWLVYKANGIFYRARVEGGSLTELPDLSYALNERDGKLVSTHDVYDIDENKTFSLPRVIHTTPGPKYLPNGVAAFDSDTFGEVVLINGANQAVVVPGDHGSLVESRPGLAAQGWMKPTWGFIL